MLHSRRRRRLLVFNEFTDTVSSPPGPVLETGVSASIRNFRRRCPVVFFVQRPFPSTCQDCDLVLYTLFSNNRFVFRAISRRQFHNIEILGLTRNVNAFSRKNREPSAIRTVRSRVTRFSRNIFEALHDNYKRCLTRTRRDAEATGIILYVPSGR